MSSSTLTRPDDVLEAARRLEGVVVRTPLLDAPWLSTALGGTIRLKAENLQHAGAFKIRGAYNAMVRLPEDVRRRGVITYSSGNHAQGIALAAKLLGVRAIVVMPTTSPDVKREGARSFGAEIVLEGTTSLERQQRAEAIAAEEGLTVIPAFDHPDVIAGQGTVGVEILEQWPDVDTIVVPVGGGGLLSGIAAYVRQTRPEVRIIGVEPDTANAMSLSLEAGRPVTVPPSSTIADGLMPVRPGDLTLAHAQAFADEVVTVTDAAILDAARQLLSRGKVVAEFSGAATTAALLSGAVDVTGRGVAAVISGGNMDARRALELIAGAA